MVFLTVNLYEILHASTYTIYAYIYKAENLPRLATLLAATTARTTVFSYLLLAAAAAAAADTIIVYYVTIARASADLVAAGFLF